MSDFRTDSNAPLQTMFFPMTNVIQNYAWGSTTSVNQLFGIANPNGEPQAEIWMGAHPNGCSMVENQGQTTKLSDLINSNINAFLGESIAKRFGELPYLFKVLAAEKALSIQVHPNKQQAETGFAREEQQGIPHTAANRNYKDPNHKPELVYALTPYQAMNGFRSIEEVIANFTRLDIAELAPLVQQLVDNQNPQGLSAFFSGLLSLEGASKDKALTALLAHANNSQDPLMALIVELETQYPGDIGLFVPLTLNIITLQPGQAMFLDAETPHAYIKGTGLEIMANSDNVLRAGLTPKYMDIDELVACTIFEEKPFDSLLLEPNVNDQMLEYPIPVEDFKFAIIPSSDQRVVDIVSAEILMPLDGSMTITHSNGQRCVIEKGQSVFIPAYAQSYTLQSDARVARAYS
ncbi:mannose-6-phosphate isomerase, class I [Vibrio panuliri]|uniref:mannose-6-phosphate isomerase n=1 Tax=Vibrio panuliri TaxID=1381081 RepID=A0ABX3F8R6_9VIBR|nr:mannose-6-phosphate isomerase, class I [Vibrio panuliri]KAB1457636.1 mannose-6-phosphate isomerase, class I [Vibrio panuliri]OLQ87285.1 mannose-6-phosphate isomerase, class I [Vibrio panuliri]